MLNGFEQPAPGKTRLRVWLTLPHEPINYMVKESPSDEISELTMPVDRVAWFRSAIQGSDGAVTDEELHVLTERSGHQIPLSGREIANERFSFIARDDEELAEIQSQRRPGRPPSKAEERITQRVEGERKEYKAGFWVPELRDEASRQKLENWSGNWAGLNNLNFVRTVSGGEIQPSTFPPKGLS
jgi:translation machinery-associated protein 16